MTPHAQSYHIITQIGTGFVTDFKHQNPAKQLQQVCTFLANPKVHSKCRCVWFFPRAAAAAAHFAVESEVTAPSWLAVLLSFRKEHRAHGLSVFEEQLTDILPDGVSIRQEMRSLQSRNAFCCTWRFNHPFWDQAGPRMREKCI